MNERETNLFCKITGLGIKKMVEVYNEVVSEFGDINNYLENMSEFEDYAVDQIHAYGISDFVARIQHAENFTCDDDYFFFNEHGNLESTNTLNSTMLSKIIDAIIQDYNFVSDLVSEISNEENK